MTAQLYNIHIQQGSEFNLPLALKNNSNPLDFTNCSCKGQIRTNYSSPIVLAEFNIIVIDALNGIIKLNLPNIITETIKETNPPEEVPTDLTNLPICEITLNKYYRYDVELTTPNGEIQRILYGLVLVSGSITKG